MHEIDFRRGLGVTLLSSVLVTLAGCGGGESETASDAGGPGGAEGAAVILGALMASRLKECDLRYNSLGSEGKQMAKDVVKSREGLTLQVQ